MRIAIPAPVPQFPDQIGFAAPVGMRADLRRAAAAAGTSCAAFIRSALVEKLQSAEGARA